MNIQDLHPELQVLVEREVNPHEKVLWVGKPRAAALILPSIGLVIFGIPWTAFAIFWICGASGFTWPTWHGPQSLFPLFGIPFVLIGFGLLSSPFWIRRSAERSGYLITTKRAIIFNWKFRGADISSYGPSELAKMQKRLKANGSGDLIFDEKAQGSGRYTKIGFIGLEDVKNVELLIRTKILGEAP